MEKSRLSLKVKMLQGPSRRSASVAGRATTRPGEQGSADLPTVQGNRALGAGGSLAWLHVWPRVF